MREAKRILIIEDDFDIRDIMKLILNEEGYQVSELENGHGVAVELLRCRPDLILLDVMLGDMDGRDICAKLKSEAETEGIPIIIVSATHGRYGMVAQGCQAEDFLQKPFDIDELVRKVNLYTAA